MASMPVMSTKQLIGNTNRWSSGGHGPQSPSAPFSPSSTVVYNVQCPTAPPAPSQPDKEMETLLSASRPASLASCHSPTPQPQTPFVTLYHSHPDQARIARFPFVPVDRATDTALLLKFHDTGFSSPSRNADPLMLAVYHGSLPDIRFFLHHGNYDLKSAHNTYGESLLHLAAASPSPHVRTVLQELRGRGGMTNVSCKDYALRTPLHVAAGAMGPAALNAPVVVKALVMWGAEVDAEDACGQTPLHLAVAVGHHQVVRLLLSHRASVGGRDKTGRTPLGLAIANRDVSLVRILVTHGAKVEGEEGREEGKGGGGGGGGGEEGGGEGGREEIEALLQEIARESADTAAQPQPPPPPPQQQQQQQQQGKEGITLSLPVLLTEDELVMPIVPEEERAKMEGREEGMEEEVLDPLRFTLEVPFDVEDEGEVNGEGGGHGLKKL